MGTARILYDDEEIRVVHRPGSSAFTLVTFGALTHRADGTAFWGDGPVGKLDLEAVGFMPKRENWYPLASVARAAPAVRGVLRPAAIGYGFSMGGYGALKHGALLGLTHAFAVSPQVSIDPADVPQDPRYRRFFRPGPNAGMRVTAADLAPVAVLAADGYDPPDRVHADLVAATGAPHRIELSFLGHAAIWLFASSSMLRRVLDLVLAEDIAGLRGLVRGRRRESVAWHRFIAREAFGRGHGAMAERLRQRAVALGMPAAALAYERTTGAERRVQRLLGQGRTEEAAHQAMDLARQARIADAGALLRLGRLLLRQGRGEDALGLFRHGAVLKDTAEAQLNLIHTLAILGRKEEAVKACQEARCRHADDPHLALNLGHMQFGREDFAAAEIAFRDAIALAAGNAELAGRAMLGLSHVLAKDRQWPEALAMAQGAVARLPREQAASAWLDRLEDLNPVQFERHGFGGVGFPSPEEMERIVICPCHAAC